MDEICEELGVAADQLIFDPGLGISTVEHPYCELNILRFDLLFHRYQHEPLLSQLAGKQVQRSDSNISSAKLYGDKYKESKSSLSFQEQRSSVRQR